MHIHQENTQEWEGRDEVRLDASFLSRSAIEFDKYHVHVYFDGSQVQEAAALQTALAEEFDLTAGKIHQRPVGPHTKGMFVFTVTGEQMHEIKEWLLAEHNRSDLSVLIHPRSGDDLLDHTDFAEWIGEPVDLDLSRL